MKRTFRIAVTVLGILVLVALAFPVQSRAELDKERVLVQFKPGKKAAVKQSALAAGGEIHYEFDELDTIAVTLPARALQGIRHNPNVLLVEQDAPRYPADQTVPYGVDSVEARDLWDADRDGAVDPGAPTGSGLMVCIIDSGVYLGHEDFAGVSFAGGDPSDWYTDTCGHGTHVAGTVAAMNNTTGVVGVSPGDVSLYIVKVYGDGCGWTYASDLIDAAQFCGDVGANIINMSLTGYWPSNSERSKFQQLYNRGILLVAAAGNWGSTAYGWPASYDSVVSVGAVNQSNVVASFSQQNDQIELVAPGVNVYSTSNNGGYVYKNGTSMATPHVSAAAALVWSSDLSKTNADIRSLLQETALDLGSAGRDNAYGFGLVQAYDAYRELNPQLPTSVELARLEANADGGAISLGWETVSEVDNLGFNLYRAKAPDGRRTQLNEGLIPSQVPPGSPEGALYHFVDDSVRPGVTYYYWLEDVDAYGMTTSHGPVSAALPQASRWGKPARPASGPTQAGW
jgi:subtilisin family serine protease